MKKANQFTFRAKHGNQILDVYEMTGKMVDVKKKAKAVAKKLDKVLDVVDGNGNLTFVVHPDGYTSRP